MWNHFQMIRLFVVFRNGELCCFMCYDIFVWIFYFNCIRSTKLSTFNWTIFIELSIPATESVRLNKNEMQKDRQEK